MNMTTIRTAPPPSCMGTTAEQGRKALDTHSQYQRRKAFANGKSNGNRFPASAGETARPRRAPGNGPGGKIEEEVPRYRVAHEDDTPSSGFSDVSTPDHDLSFVGAWDT